MYAKLIWKGIFSLTYFCVSQHVCCSERWWTTPVC